MNELEKLYNALKDKGYYTKSFEEFKNQYSDDEYKKKVYDVVSRDQLYTKDYDSFIGKYSSEVKKKEESVGEMEPMVSEPEVDSSDTSQEDRESFNYKSYLKPLFEGLLSTSSLGRAVKATGITDVDYKKVFKTGEAQGSGVKEILSAAYLGKDIGDEEAKKFAEAAEKLESIGPSDSMIQFDKDYTENEKKYGGAIASIVALGKNPEVATETVLTSMIAAARMGPEAIPELLGSTLVGAEAGLAIGGPVGIVTGAAAGLRFGVGSVLDGTMSMIEFTREELGEKPFTPENIKEIFQDEEKYKRIRNRSLARGITIGAVEAFAGAAAGKLAKPVAKVGVEVLAGGAGEVGARVLAGQEMDAREVLLESVGGLAGAPATIAEGSYKVNKQQTSAEQAEQIIDEVDAKDLRDIDITIENDDNLSAKYNEKIQKQKISEDIDPDVPEQNREQVIDLEYQRKQLESKSTVSAKEKVKQIDKKIKDLSKPVEEVAEEEVTVEKKTIDDGQVVKSAEVFDVDMDGDSITVEVKTNLDGSREVIMTTKAGVAKEKLSKDNPMSNADYVTKAYGTIKDSKTKPITEVMSQKKIDRLSSEQKKAIGLEAEQKPSKERVDGIVDEIITKTEARLTKDVDPAKKLRNVKSYLQGSKFYQEATDIERESAVRELNEKLGLKIKRPPSVKKILATPKAEKVSVDPRVILKERMGELQRATKQAAKFTKEELSSYQTQIKDLIKEVGKKGKLSKAQTIAMTNRVLKPSFTEKSISNTLDYIDKIYQNAELAERIISLSKLQRNAKKNAPKKLGSALDVINPLQKMLQIKVSRVPLDVIDDYESVLNQVGTRKAVLDLGKKSDIISKINNVLSNTQEEASIEVETETKEAKPIDKDEILDGLNLEEIKESDFLLRDERDYVRSIKSYTLDDFKSLPDDMIKKLPNVLNNVKNGFLTKDVTDVINTIEANKSKDITHNITKKNYRKKDARLAFSRAYGRLSSFFRKDKSALMAEVYNNPTFVIDDLLGNIGGKEIYNATFGKLAKAYATFETDFRKSKSEYFDKAEKILEKSKGIGVRDRNSVYKSKVKIMTYMLQREYNSNPGSNKVAPAIEFIEKTIEAIESEPLSPLQYNLTILQEIKDNFSENGQINEESLINSFTDSEKKTLSLITEGNSKLREKAIFTSGVIRGAMPEIINDYVHHDVLMMDDKKMNDYLSESHEMFVNPSTKAGTLLDRSTGAKAISFDPISSSLSGSRKTLLDYHLTNPLSQVKKTTSSLTKIKEATSDQKEAYNVIEKSVNDILEKVFLNNVQQTSTFEEILGKIKTIGYRAQLASITRSGGELASNLTYVMSVGGKAFSLGVSKYGDFVIGNPEDAVNVMRNLNSEQQSRLYDSTRISAKSANTGIFTREKIGASKAMSDVANKLSYIADNSYRPLSEFVGKFQDGVIETADKIVSRPLWFGNFDRQFKKITGLSPDIKKISLNDEQYMSEYKTQLDQATKFADEESTRAAASVNPFNTIPKNLPSPKDIGKISGLMKQANSYMTRFVIYEYTTARTAAISAIMGGKISRAKGLAMLSGSTMRMASYLILTTLLKDLLLSAFDLGKEEDEDYEEMFKRQFLGSATTLLTRRTLGNIPAIPINLGIEYVNKNYLEDLRSGKKYNPYEHSMVFSQVKPDDLKNKSLREMGVDVVSGPYGSLVRSAEKMSQVGIGLTSPRISTKIKAKELLKDRMIVEALGHMNMIPLYKDIRNLLIAKEYKNK